MYSWSRLKTKLLRYFLLCSFLIISSITIFCTTKIYKNKAAQKKINTRVDLYKKIHSLKNVLASSVQNSSDELFKYFSIDNIRNGVDKAVYTLRLSKVADQKGEANIDVIASQAYIENELKTNVVIESITYKDFKTKE